MSLKSPCAKAKLLRLPWPDVSAALSSNRGHFISKALSLPTQGLAPQARGQRPLKTQAHGRHSGRHRLPAPRDAGKCLSGSGM